MINLCHNFRLSYYKYLDDADDTLIFVLQQDGACSRKVSEDYGDLYSYA